VHLYYSITFIRSSIDSFGFFIKLTLAFNTSVKLWGGIFVAMPTAIPEDPFTNRLGIFVVIYWFG
jgi:hypothetical protein